MPGIDLSAPTEAGYHWSCCCCAFSTNSLALAMRHCEEASADYPAAEHVVHELPENAPSRSYARRTISCRTDDRALNARVTASRSRRFVRTV